MTSACSLGFYSDAIRRVHRLPCQRHLHPCVQEMVCERVHEAWAFENPPADHLTLKLCGPEGPSGPCGLSSGASGVDVPSFGLRGGDM